MKSLSVAELKQNLGSALDKLNNEGEQIVIEQEGAPRAALVSYNEYLDFREYMQRKAAKYRPFPALSPYSKTDRYKKTKEDFKFIISRIKKAVDVKRALRVADVGCANGEFIYALLKEFPHWEFTGYDITPEFIETARSFPGLARARFINDNLLNITETFELVLCVSMLQIFPDIERPLRKILDICEKDGFVFATGLFNKHDIEVRLQYCDNTQEITRGLWRVDWNQHSQASISRLIGDSVKSLEFEEMIMDLDLPLRPDQPIRHFTFRDSGGKNMVSNGLNIILNKTLMTIKK